MSLNESKPILEARNTEVERGGTTILHVPSLLIRKGEILALIGPNGAGKTTLLQALSYLLKPFQGEIFFKGEKVNSNHSIFEYRRKLAMVFQEPLLFDTTVFENVASGLKIRGMRRTEIRRRVMEQLDRFGISHLSNRSARTLSGGEAQRTSLARAFAIEPEVLLLDEPCSRLDPISTASIEESLRVLKKEYTIILVPHNIQQGSRVADRAGFLLNGKLVEVGTAYQIFTKPQNKRTEDYVTGKFG